MNYITSKLHIAKITQNIVSYLRMLFIFPLVLVVLAPFDMASASPAYFTPYGSTSNSWITTPNNTNEVITNPKPIINSITPSSSNGGVGTKTITIIGNGFVPSSVARINGSNRPTTFIDSSHLLVQTNGSDLARADGFYITVFNKAPDGGYSNANFFTIKNVVAPSSNANTSNNINSPDTFSEMTPTENTTSNNAQKNNPNLAANAIFGSNSFLPSGLTQWVFFAIIVLLIVILARRVFGGNARYQATPMKHS